MLKPYIHASKVMSTSSTKKNLEGSHTEGLIPMRRVFCTNSIAESESLTMWKSEYQIMDVD